MRSLIAALALCVLTAAAEARTVPDVAVSYDRHDVRGWVGGEAIAPEKRTVRAKRAKSHHAKAKRYGASKPQPTGNVDIHVASTATRYASLGDAFGPQESPRSSVSTNLIATAKRYLGTNPTGWARLWCGRFMAMIAPDLAKRVRNPNYARDWAQLPHTTAKVGAIAVLTRRGGGHIGVVIGFDRNGNPRIVSGNHNRRVAEAVYSKHRVIAYVSGG